MTGPCNWRAWLLPGLVTIIILTAIAVVARGTAIEQDLTTRGAATLEEDGVAWAGLVLDGRDATLSGTAPTEAARDAAIDAANRIWGVRWVDAWGLDLLPLADPYTLSLSVEGNAVTAEGSFPNLGQRTLILDGVREALGDRNLIDQTELARGAPANFGRFATFMGEGVRALQSGTVALTGATLAIAGEATTPESYAAELDRLETLPLGLTLAEVSLSPPIISPYVWSASADAAGVRLEGHVPSDEARQAILATARSFGAVTDLTELGAGAPDGFAEAAIALLDQMQGLESAQARIEDLALSLSGEAADSDAYDRANRFLGTLPEAFNSLSGRIAPPLANPFTLSLTKDEGVVTVEGHVPDETARAILLDVLDLQGLEVRDGARVARGAPTDAEIGDLFAGITRVMADWPRGSAALRGTELSIEGNAATQDAATSVESELQTLVGDLAGDAITLTTAIAFTAPPTYAFSAAVEEGVVTLSGMVPNVEMRERLVTEARTLFPGADLTDNLTVTDGAPQNIEVMLRSGLRSLGRLEAGRFEVDGTAASLSGAGLFLRAMDQVRDAAMAETPDGFSLMTDISLMPPPVLINADRCQAQLITSLEDNQILFESGSAEIDTLSFGLLDRLARTLQSCPDARVEIGGHTDSQGPDGTNQALSQARADAVRTYLVASGINDDRLTATGFGETVPIADNVTDEGRALNRRIAFTVLP